MYLLWLFYLPLLRIFFGFDVFVNGQCQGDQQTSLLQMKRTLVFNSNHSMKLVKWDSNGDCCRWPGVVCDAAGRVIELDLQNESISSGVDNSSSLFNLGYLKKLNLAYNSLNFTELPSKFENLANLRYLNLSNAGFAGQIPIEVARLTMLETLDLSNSLYVGGTFGLTLKNPSLRKLVQNLTKLTDLYLDGVNISERGEYWCQALSSSLLNLRVLSLSSCNLSGPITESLSKLQSLSVIQLSNNKLNAEVPNFLANFSNLTSLRLSYAELTGTFPKSIINVRTLQVIDLSNNQQLHGSLPKFQNAALQKLVLAYTLFSGKIPNSIGNLKMLSTIDMDNCNFSGPIPNSVAKLTALVYMDLSNNRFVGAIPSFSLLKNLTTIYLGRNLLNGSISSTDWKMLSNLKLLDLHNNSLNGDIPLSLFSIASLQKVQLSDNQFTGQFETSPNLSALQLDTLDLAGNNLQGKFPKFVFKLQNLKMLDIGSNNFSGSILLSEIQNLRNLSNLDLSSNSLSIGESDNDSNWTNFPQLGTLKMASCNLKKFPAFLKNQSKLSILDISHNQISGDIPEWIWNINTLNLLNLSYNSLVNMKIPAQGMPSSLYVLDLHENQLQGQIPVPPESIMYLDYSKNNFDSTIPDHIGKYLYFFSLSSNEIHGSIPHSICNASYLQVLDLSNNSLSGMIPECLGTFMSSTLGVLNLRRNKLNGTIPDTFVEKCKLQTLDLSKNSLEGKVPESLANCKLLEVLNIGNNKLKDSFPCHLKNISNLRVLVARSNNFHGSINCHQSNDQYWPNLQIVDIAMNNFAGVLPKKSFMTWSAMMKDHNDDQLGFDVLEYGQWYYQDSVTVTIKGLEMELQKILTLFTAIDFSGNMFEGAIPENVGFLKALNILNLSHNALDGQIPPSIGYLSNLESLDLSTNNLSGKIPSEFGNLYFLSFLNLSNNRLVGKIPTGTQLQSFSESSFEGNLGLCGPPLENNCRNSNASESVPAGPTKTSGINFDWQFIITGLGFGIGAGAIVAPILFSKTVNSWYDEKVEKCVTLIFAMLGLKYVKWESDKSLYDSDSDSEEDDDDDGMDETEEELGQGLYCVHCTKLDITRKRIIHDPKCDCHTPSVSSSLYSSASSSFSLALSEVNLR